MSEILTMAALDYLKRGHHILALNGKRPNTAIHEQWSWDDSIHGVPETPEELDALEQAFDRQRSGTTGVAILIPEHFLVADVDTESAAELFMYFAGRQMPETVTAKTTKGLHLWFAAPGAAASVWIGGRTLLLKGLGGYVAAPPSLHFDEKGVQDGVYTWIRDFNTGFDFIPDGIAGELARQSELKAAEPSREGETRGFMVVNWPKLYPGYHIEGLCKAIREAPDGNQNNMIAWAAMQARDEGVPYDVAMPQLLQAAIDGHHPRQRALTTIKGAFTRRRRV